MSFILDALRKSEAQRQREAAPSLSRAPMATVRRETPLWTWLLIALLSVALAALAIAWWQGIRLDFGRDQATLAAATEPAAGPNAGAAAAAAPGRATGAAPAGTAATGASPAGPVPAGASPTGATTAAAEPRPIGQLTEVDPNLPEYVLEFVALDRAEPATSSAWINGSRYRPGERINGGPELLEVRADSVVLRYRGDSFLLDMR
jgi:general secretion pathway protein B